MLYVRTVSKEEICNKIFEGNFKSFHDHLRKTHNDYHDHNSFALYTRKNFIQSVF